MDVLKHKQEIFSDIIKYLLEKTPNFLFIFLVYLWQAMGNILDVYKMNTSDFSSGGYMGLFWRFGHIFEIPGLDVWFNSFVCYNLTLHVMKAHSCIK